MTFDKLLSAWPKERALFFCDEAGAMAAAAGRVMSLSGSGARGARQSCRHPHRPGRRLRSGRARDAALKPFVIPVTLGPRILRADTAALAALSIWQSIKGDWTNKSGRV